MKRRIFVLLLAGMLLLLTACGGVVRPPVRIGEATGNASFNRSYSLTEAFEEADVVALVQVGNWLGEKTDGFSYTYYEADALECYKGDIPTHFTLMQSGASTSTYEDYPLYLWQPAAAVSGSNSARRGRSIYTISRRLCECLLLYHHDVRGERR